MFKQVIVAFVLAIFVQSAGAQILAKVGKVNITLKDFNEKLADMRRQTINPPEPSVFLDDLIRYEIGIQEATQQKLENDPAVKERLNQELYKLYVEKELGKKIEGISVNEAEMRDYYKKNPDIRSSHILIEFKTDSTDAQKKIAEKRANEIYEEVKNSKRPFEELVKLYSDDTLSKDTGGDVGFQNRISILPTYYDAIISMKKNQISKPVPSRYGFHIIKVTGTRPFEQSNKKQIRAAVFDVKRKKIFDAYFKKLESKYTVTIDKKLIKSLK